MMSGVCVWGGASVYLPGITDTSEVPLLWDNTFMDETLGSFHGRGGEIAALSPNYPIALC